MLASVCTVLLWNECTFLRTDKSFTLSNFNVWSVKLSYNTSILKSCAFVDAFLSMIHFRRPSSTLEQLLENATFFVFASLRFCHPHNTIRLCFQMSPLKTVLNCMRENVERCPSYPRLFMALSHLVFFFDRWARSRPPCFAHALAFSRAFFCV